MTETSRPSYPAILSIIFGILIWSIFCVGVFVQMQSGVQLYEQFGWGLLNTLGFVLPLLAVIGLVSGIVAILKKDTRRILAIIGLGLNLICIVPFLLILLISYISK